VTDIKWPKERGDFAQTKGESNMSFSIDYDQRHDCLLGAFEGDLNKQEVKAYVQEVVHRAKENNCKRFLNDLQIANISLSIADLYETPAMVLQEEFDRTWKRAVVVKEGSDKTDFYETTASNRGISIKVFTHKNEALAWLKT